MVGALSLDMRSIIRLRRRYSSLVIRRDVSYLVRVFSSRSGRYIRHCCSLLGGRFPGTRVVNLDIVRTDIGSSVCARSAIVSVSGFRSASVASTTMFRSGGRGSINRRLLEGLSVGRASGDIVTFNYCNSTDGCPLFRTFSRCTGTIPISNNITTSTNGKQ